MLAFWPVVTMMLFILLPAHRALIWSVLGAYLILPVSTSFEIPGVPSLDKTTISNLSILLCCFIFVRENWLTALKRPALMALAALFVLSPFFTAFFNPEPLHYADRFIPAMSMYDALAQAAVNGITLIPFIAAYGLINNDQRRWQVIIILVTAGFGLFGADADRGAAEPAASPHGLWLFPAQFRPADARWRFPTCGVSGPWIAGGDFLRDGSDRSDRAMARSKGAPKDARGPDCRLFRGPAAAVQIDGRDHIGGCFRANGRLLARETRRRNQRGGLHHDVAVPRHTQRRPHSHRPQFRN